MKNTSHKDANYDFQVEIHLCASCAFLRHFFLDFASKEYYISRASNLHAQRRTVYFPPGAQTPPPISKQLVASRIIFSSDVFFECFTRL